jgi:hypothetical protein
MWKLGWHNVHFPTMELDMTIREARNQIWGLRFLGGLLIIISVVLVITSALKLFYGIISADQTGLAAMFLRPIQIFIYYSYQYALFFFWNIAPDIDTTQLVTKSNMLFIFWYCLACVGAVLLNRARVIARHVHDVKDEMEREGIRRSMGVRQPARIESEIIVPMGKDEGWFSKMHALYIAPLVVILIAAIFGLN